MFVHERSGEWTVLDAGSANGTWLNGEKLVRAVAKVGDVVLVGATQLRIEEVE
jgi:pSer/pThr/pTyr-binding forkhead associated (FHA) protein